MTNNELLLAISDMMDTKLKAELQPLRNELQDFKTEIRNEMQEFKGEVHSEIHQIRLFQETYRRYRDNADRMEAVYEDVDLMKKVLADHSRQLQKLA